MRGGESDTRPGWRRGSALPHRDESSHHADSVTDEGLADRARELLRMVEEVRASERRARTVGRGTPEFDRLAAELELQARRVLEMAAKASEITEPDVPSEVSAAMQSLIAEILAQQHAAEQRAQDLPEGSLARERATDLTEQLHDLHQRLTSS